MTADRDQVTGVVLAGGLSRRMGVKNKALVEYKGVPLFRYAVENLGACCDRIVINANRDAASFQAAGFAVIDDGDFIHQGPLAGIRAALDHAKTPFVAIAACDQLVLPDSVYQTLCAEVTGSTAVYACSARDAIPTCAVLPKAFEPLASAALQSRERALMAFMRRHAQPVTFDKVTFANVNRPGQVQTG